MEDLEGRPFCKVLASYANRHSMHILYLKDPEKPGEEVDVATRTTRYVVAIGKDFFRAEFVADDFEDELLESMMGPYLFYKALQKREKDGRRSSKRKRNPVMLRQITYYTPPAHAQIEDALKRLTCPPEERKMLRNYHDAAFVNLTSFVDVDEAIDHGKDMIRWIQERMDEESLKWGQASCNLGVIHPLQLDNGLGFRHKIFRKEALGPYLGAHPLDRTKISGGREDENRYTSEFFSEVKIQAVFVWPPCFVGENNEKWRLVLGQLEMYAQSHWLATRGLDVCGNRDINSTHRDMKYPPLEANSLLSFLYSAKYISKFLMKVEKRPRRAPTGYESEKGGVVSKPRDYPHKLQNPKHQALVDDYKRHMTVQPRTLTLDSRSKVPDMVTPKAPAELGETSAAGNKAV